MPCCGIVATRRCKQIEGTSLKVMCDRLSVRNQAQFQVGMMSSKKDLCSLMGGHREQLLMHRNNNQ